VENAAFGAFVTPRHYLPTPRLCRYVACHRLRRRREEPVLADAFWDTMTLRYMSRERARNSRPSAAHGAGAQRLEALSVATAAHRMPPPSRQDAARACRHNRLYATPRRGGGG